MISIQSSDQLAVNNTFVTPAMIAASSVKKKSDPFITFLFNETIVKLTNQINSLPLTIDQTEAVEKTIRESCFYSLLKGINLQQVPLKMKILHSVILKINEAHIQVSEDGISIEDEISNRKDEIVFGIILSCFRFLSREQDWKSIDATIFFEKLYHLHTQRYGNKDVTPVLALIDEGLSAGYLSPKSQAFMDKVTYSEQFDPIKDYLLKVDGDVTDEKTRDAIAHIADKFPNKAVKISYLVMSRNVYDFPIIQYATPLIGMSEFRQITIRTKYIYMRALRESHLSYVAKAKHKTKNSIQVVEKNAVFSNQACTVSFAVAYEEEKATIKAITVLRDPSLESTRGSERNSDSEIMNQDVYFFVQELTEETPQVPPNPYIPLSERPLYKFELIPNSHYIRLQKASEEVRMQIIKFIGEIQQETMKEMQSEVAIGCTVHMAIWHQEELMLVEIIRQIGSMLSSRALHGAIKTYVKNLPRPHEGELSDLLSFKEFKTKLERVLISAYVLVTNEYLSSWHQEDLLKPMFTKSSSIQETLGMKKIKERTLEIFNSYAQPGKWLLKSMMTCGYDGNPAMLAPLTNAPIDEPNKVLQFEECKELLQAALKEKTKTEQTEVILRLVDAMVKGMVAIIQRSKEKSARANDLMQRFQSVKGFPLEKIPDIMLAKETLYQKASRLIYLFFSQKSLGLHATKKQKEVVRTFLNLEQ